MKHESFEPSGSFFMLNENVQLGLGDCLEMMKQLPDNSVDSIVTDPPYGLKFMGQKWDYDVPSVEIWKECLRVLKPGGHLLAFAGTRTQHRMACNIEDAGFEIRDMIAWVYGSGFPKSHNLKGEWQGWGTALKPALEPITFARKPFNGTVAENVKSFGTGAINIDECRIPTNDNRDRLGGGKKGGEGCYGESAVYDSVSHTAGRFPANLIHDGSDEVVACFPHTNGGGNGKCRVSKNAKGQKTGMFDGGFTDNNFGIAYENKGGNASRFFYCAKASKKDRDEGLDLVAQSNMRVNAPRANETEKTATVRKNHHPTVKPHELMKYLCRLVTPPNGTVLDPFMGSGSTGKAAIVEGFKFIGIEREQEYFNIAKERIESVCN